MGISSSKICNISVEDNNINYNICPICRQRFIKIYPTNNQEMICSNNHIWYVCYKCSPFNIIYSKNIRTIECPFHPIK